MSPSTQINNGLARAHWRMICTKAKIRFSSRRLAITPPNHKRVLTMIAIASQIVKRGIRSTQNRGIDVHFLSDKMSGAIL